MGRMSMLGGQPQEQGEKVSEHTGYEGAQKAVTQLIDADIPAKDIQIVGRGLRSIETVTGRLGYAAAARSGAINGILLGLLFSAIFVLGTPDAAIQVFIGVMFVGIAMGMLMSMFAYMIVRRRRSYASVTQVVADHYEVMVLPRSIHRAREIAGHVVAPVHGLPAPAVPPSTEPPQYGERLAPGQAAPAAPTGDAEPVDRDPEDAPPQYGERIDPDGPDRAAP